MDLIQRMEFTLNATSADMYGDMKASSLVEMFAYAADEQVSAFQNKHSELCQIQGRFILMRFHVDLRKPPKLNKKYAVKTYQSFFSKLSCVRSYEVEDTEGNVMVSGESQWIFVSDITGKAMQVPQTYALLQTDQKQRRPFPDKITEDDEYASALPLEVRYDDYDINMHVNHSKYFSYLYCNDLVDSNIYRVREVTINYKEGARTGEKYAIFSALQSGGNAPLLTQKVSNDFRTAALMRSSWVERQ